MIYFVGLLMALNAGWGFPASPDSTLVIHRKLLPHMTRLRDTMRNDIVIHNDGANLSANTVHAALRHSRLSYHYFIDRRGKIYNFVDISRAAEHAGRSSYQNTKNWNDFSIGVCLQGSIFTTYTPAQYASLNKLIQHLRRRYPHAPPSRVVGHSDVAHPKGRKKDPGIHFDWRKVPYADKHPQKKSIARRRR